MYNGIGLATPRGSGTNGYIQTSKFFIRAKPQKVEAKEFEEGQGAGGVSRKANKEILEHDRKRQLELKLMLLEEALVEQGYTDEEILEKVEETRKILEAAGETDNEGAQPTDPVRVSETQTHQIAARKERALETMRHALGLSDVKEGEAFDRELQEQRKQERIMEREEKERERREKRLQQEREEKQKEKERKRIEKEERKQKRQEEREQEKRERELERKREEDVQAEKKRKEEEKRRENERGRDERSKHICKSRKDYGRKLDRYGRENEREERDMTRRREFDKEEEEENDNSHLRTERHERRTQSDHTKREIGNGHVAGKFTSAESDEDAEKMEGGKSRLQDTKDRYGRKNGSDDAKRNASDRPVRKRSPPDRDEDELGSRQIDKTRKVDGFRREGTAKQGHYWKEEDSWTDSDADEQLRESSERKRKFKEKGMPDGGKSRQEEGRDKEGKTHYLSREKHSQREDNEHDRKGRRHDNEVKKANVVYKEDKRSDCRKRSRGDISSEEEDAYGRNDSRGKRVKEQERYSGDERAGKGRPSRSREDEDRSKRSRRREY